MNTPLTTTASRRPPRAYSGDTFAYSLPGGLARTVPWPPRTTTAEAGVELPLHGATGREADRSLVITDVASDLPSDWCLAHGITVLPTRLRFDSRSRADTGDVHAARSFFRNDLDDIGTDAQALPLSVSGTQDFIEERLQSVHDFVLQVSLSSQRGSGYLNSLTAAQNLMLQHGRARRQAGIQRPFKMWVVDSTASFNGHAVLVHESVRLLNGRTGIARVVPQLDALRRHVHVLAVPRDASFFHRHGRLDRDAVASWLSFGVGRVLDRTPLVHSHGGAQAVVTQLRSHDTSVARALGATVSAVRAGLLAPCVCMSYAGDVAEVRRWPAFVALEDACIRHGVVLQLATMSMTNALLLGRDALCVAFAADSFAL
jgi:fatty acid-binding protein DegV